MWKTPVLEVVYRNKIHAGIHERLFYLEFNLSDSSPVVYLSSFFVKQCKHLFGIFKGTGWFKPFNTESKLNKRFISIQIHDGK